MISFSSIKKNNGFSLLEVLISVFILAVGLLGLASLQMNSLKNNHSAQYRTSATVLAYDLIDRMRLNRVESYALAQSATPSGTGLKNTDLVAWVNQIASDLPSGDGEVIVSGDVVTVSVFWDDARAENSSSSVIKSITVSSER
jgi:type IV pilus assembly protein PilV